jgi:hypothetical protein
MEQTVDTLSIRQDKTEKDICEIFEKVNAGAIATARADEKQNGILTTLGEIKDGLNRIQQIPAKRWENIVGYILFAAIGGAISYFIK